jgi:hypothetical protein
MIRRSFVFLALAVILFFLGSLTSAEVPSMMNYQGKLTTASGGCLNDTLQMTFSIYPDTLGSPADWTETQNDVVVREGVFNVLLGSVVSIPSSVLDGSIKYLGVRVESDPEMTPLKPMISVAYAYRSNQADSADFAWTAENADLLDGQDASSFLSTANDYGRSGVATDLYEETSTLTDKYVNETGPETVDATSGTAFTGSAVGNSSLSIRGIRGYGENTSSGPAYGGYFEAESPGTGIQSGIWAFGHSASSASAYGVQGSAENSSDGEVYGGSFTGNALGTGTSYGIKAVSYGSSGWHYGVYGYALNSSSGYPKGGYFYASSTGTEGPAGIWAEGYANNSNYAYGIIGEASNSSSGRAVAASFYTPPSHTGSGGRTGVDISVPDSTSASTYGVYCLATNRSDGPVYGGYFDASGFLTGTGTRYGVYASANADYGWAGYFSGDVRITDSLVVLGAKSAAVKVDNGEYRLLYSQESPEVWFEDFGEGRLVNGRAVVQIDPLFAQTANTSVKYHVFLTPQDEPLTLAVANKNSTSFQVVGPTGANIYFSYRIVAKRRGYEDVRLAKMGGPTPEDVALEQARQQADREQESANREEQRQEMQRLREQTESGRKTIGQQEQHR